MTVQLPAPPAAPGTIDYNTWLGDTFAKMMNTSDTDERNALLDLVVHSDYIQHNPLVPPGSEGLKMVLSVIRTAMPDVAFVKNDLFATAEKVVLTSTWRGTVTGGPFVGVEPAGQKLVYDAVDIWTVRDGKLWEHWDFFDWTRVIYQLTDDHVLPQRFIDAAEKLGDRGH